MFKRVLIMSNFRNMWYKVVAMKLVSFENSEQGQFRHFTLHLLGIFIKTLWRLQRKWRKQRKKGKNKKKTLKEIIIILFLTKKKSKIKMGEVIIYVDDYEFFSSSTYLCRICHDEEFESCKKLEAPCACSGTVKVIIS